MITIEKNPAEKPVFNAVNISMGTLFDTQHGGVWLRVCGGAVRLMGSPLSYISVSDMRDVVLFEECVLCNDTVKIQN